ncbi:MULTISPECIES: DUF4352 domain-containing protein [unclassified Streptomyces]|uniref:DUF4352 domain-containing protein n=1 Tax=unclassified Streptomyces TaxID=2593676 RepID=UPI000B50A9F2|nr:MULTISPECIES: DUF4352 domain-containing protein [unclassified Streptomyces]MYW99934.1 DUF4352 domain-containing protein [Streptomyces sp. SID8378]SNB89902.1 protein of unknown function [Streptomyces sp. PgraA7]
MRRTTAIAAVIAAGLLFTATACTDDDITTAPSKTGAAEEAAAEPAAEDEPAKPAVAKVGDTITLKGQEDGEQVDATLKKIVDPATSADEFFGPEDGNRWVAAQFELTNTGKAPYADSPSNGAQVADADGQRFQATFGDTKAGPSMTSDAKVPPGEKVLGWITFEVPKASKIVTVQFGLNSGFAEQTGQWKVS